VTVVAPGRRYGDPIARQPDDSETSPATNPGARRRYDSPTRRRQMRETRERIVIAGAELAHGFDTWDWGSLTFRAVAERAGVGVRTVYRHFPTERDLRDAIMARLGEEAGVDYEELTLAEVAEVAGLVFRSLGSYAVRTAFTPPADPTFVAVDEQRRNALLRAVTAETPAWSDHERATLAASIDLLWSPLSYERLVSAWGMEAGEAEHVIAWAIATLAVATRSPRAARRRPDHGDQPVPRTND
jgi:AcrR family transcriptional regulator